jgi:MFS transporter, DHA1 family, inner membrane transport protein
MYFIRDGLPIKINENQFYPESPIFDGVTKKERIILFLLASLNFTHILDFMIMMPLGNYLMPYFDISARQFSYLVGAYPITAFFSSFIAAFFADRFDRKRILLFAYVPFLVGTLACGFAPTYGTLLFARVFTGLFGGLIGAQVMSIVADLFAYEKRGAATGAVMSSFAIASTIGVPFALYLSNIFSWHAPFLLIGFLGIAIVPFLVKFIPAMAGHVQESKEHQRWMRALHNVLDSRSQMLALLFSLLVMMGHFLIIPFLNPYLEFNKGFSKEQTPLIYLVGGIAAFFSAIVLGRVADKVGKLTVFSITIFLSFFAVALITDLPSIHFGAALGLFAVWFILGTGRAVTGQAMISNVVKPENRGSFMSFNSSMQQLGSGIASFASGYIVIKDHAGKLRHYDWVGYLSIFVLMLALLLARYLFAGMDKKTPVPLPQ